MSLKLVFVNILFDTYFLLRYPHSEKLETVNIVLNTVTTILMVMCIKWCLFISWSKTTIVLIVAEIRALLCGTGPVIFMAFVFNYDLTMHFGEPLSRYSAIIFGCSVILIIVTQQIGKKLWSAIREKEPAFPAVWITMLVFYLIRGIYLSVSAVEKNIKMSLYPFSDLILVAVAASLFYWYFMRKRQQLLELNNEYLLRQQDMTRQYYESMQEQIELTRKLRHDIANHLQIIESIQAASNLDLEGEAALQRYTFELKEQYNELEPFYCENVVINALISNKNKICRKNHIDFQVEFRNVKFGGISEFDLVSILCNLLDNGIESCLKTDIQSKRYIRLRCHTVAGWLFIQLENSVKEPIVEKQKFFLTSKEDKEQHGIGLKIIADIVKKYKGEIRLESQDLNLIMNISMFMGDSTSTDGVLRQQGTKETQDAVSNL